MDIHEGENTTSSNNKRTSAGQSSSVNQLPVGHVYEFIEWSGVGSLPNGDMRIKVTLKDHTASKLIEKLGTFVSGKGQAFGAMFIDTLEKHSPVFIKLTKKNRLAKVKKHSNGNKVIYCLEEEI